MGFVWGHEDSLTICLLKKGKEEKGERSSTRFLLSNNGLFFSEAQCCYSNGDMRLKPLLNCCYFYVRPRIPGDQSQLGKSVKLLLSAAFSH